MTQRFLINLFKMLLLFLLFEPIICSTNVYYNTQQNRSPFFEKNPYFNFNYGDAINRRNFQYQPYQPHYASPQLHQLQYQPKQKDQSFLYPRTAIQQFPAYGIHQRSVPIPEPSLQPSSLPLPYQGNPKKSEEETNLEDTIRSIFYMGPEKDKKIFKTTLDPKLTLLDRMHADESFKINDENTTDTSSNKPLTSLEMKMPSSSSSSSILNPTLSSSPSSSLTMNNEEPTFKVQRTPDGKLSLVFNDILSFQRPAVPKRNETVLPTRPGIVFPSSIPGTDFSGCDTYEGKSLCTKVIGYPNLAKLDMILQRDLSKLGDFFTEDIEEPFNISQRFGGDPDEQDLCNSEVKTIFPEGGETIDSRWMLILNDKNKYKQAVRVELCKEREESCNIIGPILPNNYQSFCKQGYVFRSLLALENQTAVKELFRIPSCCKCVLRRV